MLGGLGSQWAVISCFLVIYQESGQPQPLPTAWWRQHSKREQVHGVPPPAHVSLNGVKDREQEGWGLPEEKGMGRLLGVESVRAKGEQCKNGSNSSEVLGG